MRVSKNLILQITKTNNPHFHLLVKNKAMGSIGERLVGNATIRWAFLGQ